MYSAHFYFVVVLTRTMKGENNPSLSNYRTVGLSDQRDVGLSGCWTNGLSDYSYAPLQLHIVHSQRTGSDPGINCYVKGPFKSTPSQYMNNVNL